MASSATIHDEPTQALTVGLHYAQLLHLDKEQHHQKIKPLHLFHLLALKGDRVDMHPTFRETSISDHVQECIRSEYP